MNGPAGFPAPPPELHGMHLPEMLDHPMQHLSFQRVQQWAEEVFQAARELSVKDQRCRHRADELLNIADGLSKDQQAATSALGQEQQKNKELVALVEEMIAAKAAAEASQQHERTRLNQQLRAAREQTPQGASQARILLMESQIDKLTAQNEMLTARAERAEAAQAGSAPVGSGEMAANQMRVIELEGQLASKEGRLQALSGELARCEARLRGVCESKAVVARQADVATSSRVEEAEVAELKRRLAESEEGLCSAEQELVSMLSLWEAASQRLVALGHKMAHLEQTCSSEVRLVEGELEECSTAQSALHATQHSHQAQCDALLTAHHSTQQQLDALATQLRSLQHAHDRQQTAETLFESSSAQLVAAHEQAYRTQQSAQQLQDRLAQAKGQLDL